MLLRKLKSRFVREGKKTLNYLKMRACERFKDIELFEKLANYEKQVEILAYEKIRIEEELEQTVRKML
jgi:hypothetical protein